MKAQITEYQDHGRTCPCCGVVTRAVIPENIRAHSIGPGLAALMSYLVGSCGVSKRRVEELVESVFEVPVARNGRQPRTGNERSLGACASASVGGRAASSGQAC